jgi:membrane protease YdiL (CAAX protease family)
MSSASSAIDRRVTVALLVFGMCFPTLMAWLYFRELAGGQEAISLLQRVVFSGGKVIQFGLPVVWLWLTERRLWAIRRPRFDGWPIAIGFGLLVAASMLGLYYFHFRASDLLIDTPEKVRAKLDEFRVTTPESYVLVAAFFVVAHSLLEEYYWRWFVFGRLRTLLPTGAAIVLSSLAFMSHHVLILDGFFPGRFFATLPFSLGIAVGGAVWAWLYARADSVWPSWLSHALVDAAIFFIGWDLVFRGA